MKKLLVILAIIVVLIGGCTSTNSAEDKMDIRGNITSIYIDEQESIIKVDIEKDKAPKYLTAIVNINKDTVIQNKDNSKTYNIKDLELGMTVKVIFNETVVEDDLVKGVAKFITVINE